MGLKQRNRVYKILLTFVTLFQLSSCSYLEKRGAFLSKDKKKADTEKVVPKAQYDELALKYAELLKKSKEVRPNKKSEIDSNTKKLTKSLEAITTEAELAETVDVFSKKASARKEYINYKSTEVKTPPNYESLSSEISQIRKAKALLAQKKYDFALTILKELDLSGHRQIRVRAKFLIGELLFLQSEFDLALQIFEEIISKEAFSGVVLKTLGRMIVCTEKLGQSAKKEKYYSILHDFFESNS